MAPWSQISRSVGGVDAVRGRALGPLGVWGIAVSRLSAGAARFSESFRRTCGVTVASLHLPQSLTKPIETEAPLSDECEEAWHASSRSRAMKTEGIEGTERFLSPGKGRGLKATKQFKVGDLVFACPAYAYVLTVNERGGHCECCFTRSALLISPRLTLCVFVYGCFMWQCVHAHLKEHNNNNY